MQTKAQVLWGLTIIFATIAGVMDLRSRRLPNWWTVPGAVIGLLASSLLFGWAGTKQSLAGLAVGLLVLLPFVVIRLIGAGDWKLVGASGAFLWLANLWNVLLYAFIINALMALVMVMVKGRLLQMLRNLWRLLRSLLTLHAPPPDLTLDSPESVKVPFGVAWALAVLGYAGAKLVGRV